MASIHQKMLVITSICLCLLVVFVNGGTNSTLPATSNTTSTNTTSTNTTSTNSTSTNTTSTNATSTNTTSTNTTSTNTTSTNTTSTNTTSPKPTSSNTTSTNTTTNSTGTGTSNTTSTAAANTTSSNTTTSNTTSSNTTSSNTTSSNVTASNTTSTNRTGTSNTTSTAAANTTSSNTTTSNTTSSNTTSANVTASNTTSTNKNATSNTTSTAASNTTASNTTASNKTASNTTASNTTASNTTASNTTSTNSTGSSTNTSAVSSNSTSTSNSTGATGSSTGNTTGTGNGTAVSPTPTPIATPTKTATVKVKVDQTSLQGTALVIGVIKGNLSATSAYLDTTKAENRNFVNAAPKINEKLKTSTVGGQIIGNLTFENIVQIDTYTVRAEYMTEVSTGITSDPIFGIMNGLDQKTIFGTTDLKYKVDFVPLTVKNRWHDGKVRLPLEFYKPSLREPDSEDFKNFKNVFETLLREQLLRSVPVVRQVVIKDVLQGSIIVPFAVETNENSTNTTTQSLKTALDTVTSIGDYTVDPNEDSKSMTGSVYISGLQRLDPMAKEKLPALAIPTRDGEDIKRGVVSLEEKNKVPVRKSNYFLTVTIPSFAALLFGIVIFLCCTATATRMMNNNNTKNVP
ncbi:mucin-21-like isoform X2 [Macrobrachium nipponense]|uniref:mucin-21-like isoform X2 n=1 Tax=Macrobrachium nipponense TaxID=159736 RepID=UPI0030C8A61A